MWSSSSLFAGAVSVLCPSILVDVVVVVVVIGVMLVEVAVMLAATDVIEERLAISSDSLFGACCVATDALDFGVECRLILS